MKDQLYNIKTSVDIRPGQLRISHQTKWFGEVILFGFSELGEEFLYTQKSVMTWVITHVHPHQIKKNTYNIVKFISNAKQPNIQ